ncbi:hypothetical protein B0H14DRAFT_2567831 [Mycena olivaceomarginata]|nr:hypothetical protein B0H14DRAFT_2567831 [Mycena olivaceomarginata]
MAAPEPGVRDRIKAENLGGERKTNKPQILVNAGSFTKEPGITGSISPGMRVSKERQVPVNTFRLHPFTFWEDALSQYRRLRGMPDSTASKPNRALSSVFSIFCASPPTPPYAFLRNSHHGSRMFLEIAAGPFPWAAGIPLISYTETGITCAPCKYCENISCMVSSFEMAAWNVQAAKCQVVLRQYSLDPENHFFVYNRRQLARGIDTSSSFFLLYG